MPELDINGILQQYHDKFDDSKVRELLEELEQMMYERALFFSKIDNYDSEGDVKNQKLSDDIDKYWRDLNNLKYGSDEHNEILNSLRSDVQGYDSCWCCNKVTILRTKIMQSIPTEKMYLVNMCEKCYSDKIAIASYGKQEINADTKIPDDLTDEEKSLMRQFQESLPAESQVE